MTTFLKLLTASDKPSNLLSICTALRTGATEERAFQVVPEAFRVIPGVPFAYWTTPEIRSIFKTHDTYAQKGWKAVNGLTTGDDFRFVRAHWEIPAENRLRASATDGQLEGRWATYAKGGEASPFLARFPVVLNWASSGREMRAFAGTIIRSDEYYLRSGLTWPLRARRFEPQFRPRMSIFSVRGYSAIADECDLPAILGLTASTPFDYLFKVCLGRHGFPEFVVGTLSKLPVPHMNAAVREQLSNLATAAWSLRRSFDSIDETSHAFALPATLRGRLLDYDPLAIETELRRIQVEIDTIAFDLFGFSEADRAAVLAGQGTADESDAAANADDESDDENSATPIDNTDGLLSWAVGVAFGRFDWRLATGERSALPEPAPFDPLPATSPGMLTDGAAPFHAHAGILVDDVGHPHDLVRVQEEVLNRVDAPVSRDLRRWIQKDFFSLHLQRYSKSRRKAPIYWPLSTVSGNYTLWIYYPDLSRQTLYTAINDFVGPKLKQVDEDVTALRNKGGARTRDDEKQFEALQTMAQELNDLRDTLQGLAQNYQPNHDDGVQITAAPLWPLFCHKPWQKVLKDTWTKLQKGDYDWAHLAMAYWPDRVREKCKTDKSLAIAHGLEEVYVEPETTPKKIRGRKKADT